jgi:hypothetical protein
MPQPPTPAWSASLLRRDLSARAHHLARTQNLLHDISPGASPVVIFGRDEQGRHGNFHPASDTSICANPTWLRRLTKVHTASRRSRARKDWQWRELDSANSSDALLMNIFCHPGVFNGDTLAPAVASLLNIDAASQPCFGINPRVPLKHLRKRPASRKPQTNFNEAAETQTSKHPGAPEPALSLPKGLDSETWVHRLRTFGEKAGLAFQIVDDVLDMTQSSEELGKTAGKDTATTKATWPAVFGIQKSLKDAEELIADAFAALEPFGPAATPLKSLAQYLVERKN